MPEVAEVENGYHTCRLTVVQDGLSDSVIKIYPAMMKDGKVWTGRVRHKEWWDMVQENLKRYVQRGTYFQPPAPYHNDPKNLRDVTLTEDKIPLVKLEGWVLPNLPPEDPTPVFTNDSGNLLQMNKRIEKLEGSITELVAALTRNAQQPTVAQHTIEVSHQKTYLECCGMSFKDSRGIAAHRRAKHKNVS